MNNIVITKYNNYIFSGFFNDFKLLECDLSPDNPDEVRVGDVYVGYVENIVAGINGAFVRIKPGINGYYSLENNKSHFFLSPKSNDKLAIGDKILVQVEKEPIKGKPLSLTSRISIAGMYCVAVSDSDSVMISQKITSQDKRNQLKELIEPLTKQYKGGIVVRTNSTEASSDTLLNEAKHLLTQLEHIITYGLHQTLYSKVYSGPSGYRNFVYNYPINQLDRIITDIEEVYETLRDSGFTIQLYNDDYSLSALYNINRQLEKSLSKKVWLDCGGFLIIEPTEALTVIDVNSGKFIGKKNSKASETYYKINLEAANEIVHQLRLRNLSGIIIIDFINISCYI